MAIISVVGEIVSFENVQDHSTFEASERIAPKVFKNGKKRKESLELTLPPHSVVILTVD